MRHTKWSKWVVVGALLAAPFLVRPGTQAADAAQVLYDDFNDPSNLINGDRWLSTVSSSGVTVLESIQLVDRLLAPTGNPNGKLAIGRHMVVRSGASSGFDRSGYDVVNPTSMTGIQADIAMLGCVVSDGSVQARVYGAGFGNGSASTGPGDQSGDILGILRIECTSSNQPELRWLVVQCNNAACTSSTQLGNGTFQAVNVGEKHTLHVQIVGSSFVFTADGQPQKFIPPGSLKAPKLPFFQIGTRMDASSPANGGQFVVAGTFDNVFVDQ
jgi:hypothetical protein